MSSAAPRPLSAVKGRQVLSPPRYLKPVGPDSFCDECILKERGHGYVPAFHPPGGGPVLLLGEAPGVDEAIFGEPFVGAAGSMLGRVLRLLGRLRESHTIDNVFRCALPGGSSERQSWAQQARDQCRYREGTIAHRPKVIVPLGGVALRTWFG